jgi:hypothetical protein
MPIADSFPRLRRLSRLILLLAAVLIYFGVVAPNTAEDHAVTLELQGPTGEITKLETLWTGIDVNPGEAVGGATFNYPSGQVPSSVGTTVHSAPGVYWLDVTVHRGSKSSTIRRRISLSGGDTKVFLPLE